MQIKYFYLHYCGVKYRKNDDADHSDKMEAFNKGYGLLNI